VTSALGWLAYKPSMGLPSMSSVDILPVNLQYFYHITTQNCGEQPFAAKGPFENLQTLSVPGTNV
jgi:hypothetical protein